jgi:16S rRNA (adenine1518-N6/adenine1519-N6)-dimethyltransferase
VAQTDGEDYGVLSLLIQLHYEPKGMFKIPSDCFFPAPDVDSACVALKRREQPLLPAGLNDTFARLVKLALSQRRKMMLKLLKQNWPVEKLTAAFEQLQLSPQIRAEKVSLEQFVQLTKLLSAEKGA